MSRRPPRAILIVAAVAVAAVVGAVLLNTFQEPAENLAADKLRRSNLMIARQDWSIAEQLAREAAALDPNLTEANIVAAKCAMHREDYPAAIDDLSRVDDQNDPEWPDACRLRARVLHFHLHRFAEAEVAYRDVLQVEPDDVEANDGYARLLGLCGRRQEAIPCVIRLIKAGEKTDLLMLLSRESGILNNPELLAAARIAAPEDPNPLMGLAAAAAARQEHPVALERLQQAASFNGLPPGFYGMLGQQLLACDKSEELQAWAADFDPEKASGDAWMALGDYAESLNDQDRALRCYWEAVKLQPESLSATNHLARRLKSSAEPERAAPFLERVEKINALRAAQKLAIMSSERPSHADIVAMIKAYEDVGRLWEAYGWCTMAADTQRDPSNMLTMRNEIGKKLPHAPLTLTASTHNPALQADLSHLPFSGKSIAANDDTSDPAHSTNVAFLQQGSEVGFDFRFHCGLSEPTHRMQEFSGGGIAAFDFDGDLSPDIFCTQGQPSHQPPASRRDVAGQLFRNSLAKAFTPSAGNAKLSPADSQGQGVSAGDVNNDGFPDLYIANTQQNCLWINNGDGTFTERSHEGSTSVASWTTSCVIADVNGDGVPDLYDVNYLAGDDVFTRTCTTENGDIAMCAPYDFPAATDRLWLGDGTGGFKDRTADLMMPAPAGKGLGIVAMRSEDSRLSLFISNDTTANFYYAPASATTDVLTETAVGVGLAFSAEGKAEACMGIAVADCNQDGRLDFLVTNYLHESNTLYSLIGEGLFDDITRSAGLHDVSLQVLGFGTQFLDANLDGRFELFVANGHTNDLSSSGTPYAMRPQMFEWTGERFVLLPAEQCGAWCNTEVVGRAVARLDWNRDGRPDLAVGLLDEAYFLLTNDSETRGNRRLDLKLVATSTARDAIGTTVSATIEGTTQTHQLTAGDGFQCTNLREINVGCGSATHIDRLRVVWPSGSVQDFVDVEAGQLCVLVEDRKLYRVD